MDIGVWMSPVVLAHKLEARAGRNTLATWNTKSVPRGLGQSCEEDRTPELLEELEQQRISAIDMVTSAFLTVAQVRNKKAGAILAVSDECLNGRMGFRNPRFLKAEEKMVEVALKAIHLIR